MVGAPVAHIFLGGWGWWVVWKNYGKYGDFCLKDLWEFLLKKSLVF